MGRPHGLDGSFHVTKPSAPLEADVLVVAGVERRVERRSGTADRPILRLEGIADRPAVEALRGEDLLGPTAELPADEFAAADLEGCEVRDGDRVLGTVRQLLALPSCDALELDPDGTLVPLVHDAVRSIDLEARRIDVDAGFLGL